MTEKRMGIVYIVEFNNTTLSIEFI